MDRAIVDDCRVDYFRVGSYRDDWDRILKVITSVQGLTSSSLEVTRRRLTLGAPDSVTGWYEKGFTDPTIEMVIMPRGATQLMLAAGVFAREDAVGLTADVVEVGDQVKNPSDNTIYEVSSIQKVKFADSFSHRICDLKELPYGAL